MPSRFRYTAMGTTLTVEKCTENVPDDGRYYLLDDGQALETFSSRKKAVARFRELLKERGYQPPEWEPNEVNPFDETLRGLDVAKEVYWHYASRYRTGGKGR